MSTPSLADARALEQLSALADGELDAAAAEACCGAWRGNAQARASWHAYQLIGDVLRSDDLAADPGHDAAFLTALRARLEREPVVFAPGLAALSASGSGSPGVERGGWARVARRWSAPSAVAAGFAVVIGVALLGRPDGPAPVGQATTLAGNVPTVATPAIDGRRLARVDGSERTAMNPTPAVESQGGIVASGSAGVTGSGQSVLRDASLDRYLSAHKQFANSSALGVPSVFLRSATVAARAR